MGRKEDTMYFFTIPRLYDGNLVHIVKRFRSDKDDLRKWQDPYNSQIAAICTFDDRTGDFKPLILRLPHSREWVSAKDVNLMKVLRDQNEVS